MGIVIIMIAAIGGLYLVIRLSIKDGKEIRKKLHNHEQNKANTPKK